MLIQVGEVVVRDPQTGEPITFKVVEAGDPIFNIPVARISIPKGPQSKKIGLAIADHEESGLIVPDFIPPEEMPGSGS
jgi:hypothetical protein